MPRSVPHHLLGYAADVHTSPPQAPGLDHGSFRTIFRGALRAGEAAAAAADAEEIERF